MRPIHLNLASRPYRDYRPVYAAVVVASLLIAFLMLNNIDTYYRYVRDTRTTYQKIAGLVSQAETERNRAQQADAQLRGINLLALDQDTRFINARLAERAFSWSELLARLEGVLPNEVRIRTIAPSFSKSGLVHLEFACDAKTDKGMLDTIERLMKDPHFANAFPRSETQTSQTSYAFNVGVDYKPSIPRPVEK